jgi:hypothetical protein
MPEIPRVVSAPVEYSPIFSARFALRFAVCLLLTSLDAGVISAFGPALYRVSADHPSWLAGLAILFTTMLGSLLRVWMLTLRSRSR